MRNSYNYPALREFLLLRNFQVKTLLLVYTRGEGQGLPQARMHWEKRAKLTSVFCLYFRHCYILCPERLLFTA